MLINPYGEPSQYPPGQDIQLSSSDPATSPDQLGASVVSVATAVTGVKAGEEPMETPVPNGSYNRGSVSVGAVVGLTLGSMAFLLAVTLLIMIIGSRHHRDSNHSDNSGETPTPEYSETGNSLVCQFALSIDLTSASAMDDSESAVMWKIERDLNVNGTLPAYSDIMTDGSSFAAMKNITQRNSIGGNSIGYNYNVRDTHTHAGCSNFPVTHSTTLAEGDGNADRDSVDNSVGHYISSRDNTV
ncbi:hypothetical protein BGZ80_000567 [Entomortierella chlamydospora]|uniref:Uncharacterized protein n=1 Tax=Entomortierella chlamydospora TaxID=101097 RepID=A0A9P6MSQ3_9FUNG|nr:hypothetical protein BGZ79_000658 [Entomortierella chlamydospora]KAG0011595.1 hypothetical protein BGZ80_000567 [Entomortierella chlamydospora]